MELTTNDKKALQGAIRMLVKESDKRPAITPDSSAADDFK